MSLDTIPIGDAVQQLDVGPLSFIPLLGVAASLLPYPKRMPLALLGPLMPFFSDHFPMCMRQETVEDAPSYAFWDPEIAVAYLHCMY